MSHLPTPALARRNSSASQLFMAIAGMALVTFAPETMAQLAETTASVCGFFSNLQGLLSMASIAVVTIAVIFAGYQIAFAHKRIADVAPILVGGLLIGAAGQIAVMLLPTNTACAADAGRYLLNHLSAIV